MFRAAALGVLGLLPACIASTPYDLRYYPPRAASVYVSPPPSYVPQVDVDPGPQILGPTYRSPSFYGGRYYRVPYYYGRTRHYGRPYYNSRPYYRPYYHR